MKIWAVENFPPFYLLQSERPRHGLGSDWRSRVPALLRARKLFPLLATLDSEDGREVARWEVTMVEESSPVDAGTFGIPAGMHRLE